MKFKLVFTTLWLTVAGICHCAVINVPADQPNIQAGVDVALDGDTVMLAPGNYTGDGNKNIDTQGKTIIIQSESGPENTVIDCQYFGRGFDIHSGESSEMKIIGLTIRNGLVSESGGGFIAITNSSPEIRSCIFVNTDPVTNALSGGGIRCGYSSAQIIDCRFLGTKAYYGAGAVSIYQSNPTISNCVFSQCSSAVASTDEGGALGYNESAGTLSNCIFINNHSAGHGGGVNCDNYSAPYISNCGFYANFAELRGGGLFIQHYSTPTINQCFFKDNSANRDAGGIGVYDNSALVVLNSAVVNNSCQFSGAGLYSYHYSESTVVNCLFRNNVVTVGGVGGGVCSSDNSTLNMTNCHLEGNHVYQQENDTSDGGGTCLSGGSSVLNNVSFFDNSASRDGGGLYVTGGSHSLSNCTFAGNQCNTAGGAGNGYGSYIRNDAVLSVENSILWDTDIAGQEVVIDSGSVTMDFCNIQGGWAGPGSNNFSVDPEFTAGPYGNYHLGFSSTSQNAGNANASDVCFTIPAGQICMNELSTLTDLSPDTDVVDLGYHYPLGTPTATPADPTHTPTPTPTPTDQIPTKTPTLRPTETGTPTPTPYMYSPTPYYTNTPTLPPTSTQTTTVTPTTTPSQECLETGVTLEMPSENFQTNDVCYLYAWVCNLEGSILTDQPVFVILDIDGSYWFAPTWIPMDMGIDYYSQTCQPGITRIEVLPEFNWPSNIGSATGIVFWGAMTDPSITELLGTFDSWTFGWN